MRKKRVKNKVSFVARACIIAAVAVLLVGASIAWHQYRANQTAAQHAADATRNANHGHGTSTTPSTTPPKPDAFDRYQVPPANPRYIFIDKLSVRAMVKPLALTGDDRLAAPTNVFDAGWYTGSAMPGQAGAMVIDGHVSSWTVHGIFYEIKKLRPGDTVRIERGDGQKFTYRVVKQQIYNADSVDMQAVLAPVNASKPGLNLITCDGSVIKGTNEFDRRIVVFTEQV